VDSDGERVFTCTYPCDDEEAGEDSLPGGQGYFATVCWALQDGGVDASASPGTAVKPVDRVALGLLSTLLMGRQTSPLNKALIDSGLGTSVTGGGLSSYVRQSMFGAGLKGLKSQDDMQKVKQIVLQSLADVASNGFDEEHVRSELNTLNFNLREFGSGGTPK